MSWYYACKKVLGSWGEEEYTVVECFPDLEQAGSIVPHTENAVFFGETPEELVKWLHAAADGIEKHGVINGKV